MKSLFLISILSLLFLSCSSTKDDDNTEITDITFKILSDTNHPGKVTILLFEANNISINDIENISVLPYTKSYKKEINFSVDVICKYKDKTTAAFSQYNVVLQVLKNGTVVKEENIQVIAQEKETTIVATIIK